MGEGFCGNCAAWALKCIMYVVSAIPVSLAKNRCTFLRLANFLVFFAVACRVAYAQIEVKQIDPAYPRLARQFEQAVEQHEQRPLACHVEAVHPRLSYSFRFFSGFYTTVPAKQFEPGKQNRMAAFMRVTSESTGEEHYFFHPFHIPTIPEDPGKTQLEAGGGFYIGDGNYKVDWLLVDQRDRVCTRTWLVKTPKAKVPLLVPAGSILPLGLESWKGFGDKKKVTEAKVTVFLSAMPLYRRRMLSKLPPYDMTLLLSSLTTLLNGSKYTHARVVAFDLLSKRVLFEQDEFDPAGYERLRDKLETESYGTIDVQSLARGFSDRKLLEDMLKQETGRDKKSDAVVFLGAEGSPSDKLPPLFAEYRQGLAQLYYVFFARFPQPVQDVMWQFVRGGKGKIVNLFGPPDLVNAIKAIDAAN